MQRLSRDQYTTVLDPSLPPAITIASGEELVVETWDAYKGVWGADQEPPEVGAATGPIAVEGADAGDALRIDILAITPATAAMHDVRPGRGFLGETFTERRPTVMPIRDGHLMFPGGINIPLRPSIGLIATHTTMFTLHTSDRGTYVGVRSLMLAGDIPLSPSLPPSNPGKILLTRSVHEHLGK